MKGNIFGDLYKRYVFNTRGDDMDKNARRKLFVQVAATIVIIATAGIIVKNQAPDIAVLNFLGLVSAYILGRATCRSNCCR